ncbi:hypothetical protein F4808DRAFT_442850 [Astrocystis sublimbata]|nr:hypothetical protein F4808DRAFT_442850 [Astrocystis sublimbata]
MPVVFLPVQQSHNISSPGISHLDQAFAWLTLAAAFVGSAVFLALVVSFSKSYKTSSRPISSEVRAMTTTRDWAYFLPKLSRETSTRAFTMSVSRKADTAAFRASDTQDEDNIRGVHDLPQSARGRQKRPGGPETLRAGTDDLQDFDSWHSPMMPLTPTVPSSTAFSLQDRRSSVAASTNGDYDPALTRDEKSHTDSPEAKTASVPNARTSSPIAMRQSYSNTLSVDPPHFQSAAESGTGELHSPLAPSSFPSSSPILPLAPHASLESRETDVSGEHVMVTHDSGADWKRHTRVYGGGVCLACLASGGDHGGGFYGENVPLDQRR